MHFHLLELSCSESVSTHLFAKRSKAHFVLSSFVRCILLGSLLFKLYCARISEERWWEKQIWLSKWEGYYLLPFRPV